MHNMTVTIQEIENGVVLNINHDGMYPGNSYFYPSMIELQECLTGRVNIAWTRMKRQAQEYSQPAGNESILSRAYSQQQANTAMYDQYNALSENERRIRERIQAGEQELAAEQADPGECPVQEGMKDKTVENWRDKLAKHETHETHTPEDNKRDEQRERLYGRDGILGD